MTSAAARRACSGVIPSASYMRASSSVSAVGWCCSSRRSISTSRSISSFCAETLIHSPAAMLMPPAIAPASPARRTMDDSAPPPAKPRISDTLDTSPSLTPNTAARAVPPATARWPGWCAWWSVCTTTRGYDLAVRRSELQSQVTTRSRQRGRRREVRTWRSTRRRTPAGAAPVVGRWPRHSDDCATSPPYASPTTRCSCASCRCTTPSSPPATSTTASSTTSTPSPSPT